MTTRRGALAGLASSLILPPSIALGQAAPRALTAREVFSRIKTAS